MSRYKPYPKYKESGVEWLGEVPSDWLIVRNKQLFNFKKDLVGDKSDDYLLLSLTLNGIKPRDIENGKGKFPAEFNTYQIVEPNDVVFCLFDIDETPRTVGLSSDRGMITGAYNVARCHSSINPKFVYYYYLSIDEHKGLKPFYTGLRKVVRPETFMNIQLALPSFSEQTAIANFLDRETAKIDTLIEKQQRLIALLQEKRQAVISHAVTKGLDPNVKMKDSGVAWLGEVPEHWEVSALKYNLTNLDHKRIPINSTERESMSGEYPYYGASGIIDYVNNYIFNIKTILIGEDGANLIMRSSPLAFIAEGKYWVNNHAHILFPNDGIHEYWVYVLNNIDIAPFVSGSAQPKLTAEALGNLLLAYPAAIKERKQIADYLDEQTTKIDTLIEKANQAITLLKERRTALISAAVMGKIDVREGVA